MSILADPVSSTPRQPEIAAYYRAYRQRIHHLSLESGGSLVPSTEFTAERAAVSGIWQATMEG